MFTGTLLTSSLGAFTLWMVSGPDWELLANNLTTVMLAALAVVAVAVVLACSELFGQNRSNIDPWLKAGNRKF